MSACPNCGQKRIIGKRLRNQIVRNLYSTNTSTPQSGSFIEAYMVSPSPAQIENGKQLIRHGRTLQILAVITVILGGISGYYLATIAYGSGDILVYWIILSFLGGVKLFLMGRNDVEDGKFLFEDTYIASDFTGMDGHSFNYLVVKVFRALDFTCENLPMSGDRGADFLAEKEGVRYVVQTKLWKNKVGDPTIQKLVGSKAWYNADKAICVTNSEYTKPARQWENRGVELIDGKKLDEMIMDLHNR